MGGKGGGSSINVPPQQDNPYTKQLADMASQIWGQTQPVRNYFTEDWQKFFRPETGQGQQYNPYNIPGYAPLYDLSRTGIEDQYGNAKEQILSGLPRGGAQANAIGNLAENRARAVGSLQTSTASPLIQKIMDQAYGAGWTTGPTQAITGMTGAGQQQTTANAAYQQLQMAAAMQEAQASNASSSAKGSGVGSVLGKGLGAVLDSVVPGVGTAIGGAIGVGLGKGAEGITSGLGGYTALANQANPLSW